MTTCATQTLADLAARLGSEAKARMVLGNFNNLVAFRTKDRPTQEYVVEQLGNDAQNRAKSSIPGISAAARTDLLEPYSPPATSPGKRFPILRSG